jgi:hypothetical protein
VFFLDPQDRALDLEGQLIGLTIRRTTPVVEGIKAAFLVTVVDLIASDAGRSSIGLHSFHGIWVLPKYLNV